MTIPWGLLWIGGGVGLLWVLYRNVKVPTVNKKTELELRRDLIETPASKAARERDEAARKERDLILDGHGRR